MNYKLVEKRKDDYETFKVTIVADSNDADYITETKRYTKNEFEGRILSGLNHLKQTANEDHQLEDYQNPFNLSLPFSDWGPCHTLESISVEFLDATGKSWDVEIEYEKIEETDDEE